MGPIIRGAVINNINLVKEILNKFPTFKNYISTVDIKKSKSTDIVSFIHEYFDINFVITKSLSIGYQNKTLVNYILDKYIFNDSITNKVLLRSAIAFEPYEYANLLIEYIGCITDKEKQQIIIDILNAGQYHKARVLLENISICYS